MVGGGRCVLNSWVMGGGCTRSSVGGMTLAVIWWGIGDAPRTKSDMGSWYLCHTLLRGRAIANNQLKRFIFWTLVLLEVATSVSFFCVYQRMTFDLFHCNEYRLSSVVCAATDMYCQREDFCNDTVQLSVCISVSFDWGITITFTVVFASLDFSNSWSQTCVWSQLHKPSAASNVHLSGKNICKNKAIQRGVISVPSMIVWLTEGLMTVGWWWQEGHLPDDADDTSFNTRLTHQRPQIPQRTLLYSSLLSCDRLCSLLYPFCLNQPATFRLIFKKILRSFIPFR